MYYRQALSLEDYQHVRSLRNTVKSYMTNDRQHITEQQQQIFMKRADPLFLYFTDYNSFIGYSLIKEKGGRYFGSLAIVEEFRGKGFGVKIYKHMQEVIQTIHTDLWLDIYCDNNPSIIAALKAGFEFYNFCDDIMTFVYRSESKDEYEGKEND